MLRAPMRSAVQLGFARSLASVGRGLVLAAWGALGACSDEAEGAADASLEAARAGAWLETSAAKQSFGTLAPGAKAAADFELVARGAHALVIEGVRKSCGCTAAELRVRRAAEFESASIGQPYPPGTRFQLHAELGTEDRAGPQLQRIYVDVAEQADPLVLTLEADIEAFFRVEPPLIEIRGASSPSGGRGNTLIVARDGRPFRPSCSSEFEHAAVRFIPLEPDAEGRAARWRMEFRLLPGVPAGMFSARVVVASDVPNEAAALDARGKRPGQRAWVSVQARVESAPLEEAPGDAGATSAASGG